MKERLVRSLAHVEAFIDFDADETNDLGEIMQPIKEDVKVLIREIQGYLNNSKRGETIREG